MKISVYLSSLGKKQKGDFRRAFLAQFPEVGFGTYYRKILADRWLPKETEFIADYMLKHFGIVVEDESAKKMAGA